MLRDLTTRLRVMKSMAPGARGTQRTGTDGRLWGTKHQAAYRRVRQRPSRADRSHKKLATGRRSRSKCHAMTRDFPGNVPVPGAEFSGAPAPRQPLPQPSSFKPADAYRRAPVHLGSSTSNRSIPPAVLVRNAALLHHVHHATRTLAACPGAVLALYDASAVRNATPRTLPQHIEQLEGPPVVIRNAPLLQHVHHQAAEGGEVQPHSVLLAVAGQQVQHVSLRSGRRDPKGASTMGKMQRSGFMPLSTGTGSIVVGKAGMRAASKGTPSAAAALLLTLCTSNPSARKATCKMQGKNQRS